MGRGFNCNKFGLWVAELSSTEKSIRGRGRALGNSSILLQIEKAAKSSDGDFIAYSFNCSLFMV